MQPGQRVLDVGCGTTTLTIMLKQTYPDAWVVGLDGDSQALEIARRKPPPPAWRSTFTEP